MTLFPGDKAIELYYFGVGHTTGDIVVYFPEEKTDIEQHLKDIVSMQEKIESLVKDGKSLDETKAAFNENESRLVESVYTEINAMK